MLEPSIKENQNLMNGLCVSVRMEVAQTVLTRGWDPSEVFRMKLVDGQMMYLRSRET